MSFDASKDAILWSAEIPSDGPVDLVMSIRRYDGGRPKVQIQRTGQKKDGTAYYQKLGRLSLAEMQAICETWNTRPTEIK